MPSASNALHNPVRCCRIMILQLGVFDLQLLQMQVPSLRLPKWRICRPAIGWVTGLILGIVLSYRTDFIASLMRGILSEPVSIVGLFAVSLLPYFLTALAVFVSKPGWVPIIAFCKAFCFGFCAAAMDRCFGSTSWLLRFLIMFSDIYTSPVLLWVWFGCGKGEASKGRFLICGAALLLILAMDYWFISPILAMI